MKVKDITNLAKAVYDNFSTNPGLKETETNVIKEYGEYFRSGNFDWDIFEKFTKYDYNKEWTSLDRNNIRLKPQFDKLKNTIRRLLDESLPIQERLQDVIRGKYKVKGAKIGIFSAILLVSYPDKYATWNSRTLDAVNGILDDDEKKFKDPARDYQRFNNFVNGIAKDNGLTLWELDWLWSRIQGEEAPKDKANLHRWWVEKTYVGTHRIQVPFDSDLGKALWSPETDRTGKDIYANMRKVKENDLIIHLVMDNDKSIVGVSRVDRTFQQFDFQPDKTPPSSGITKGIYVYLKDFTRLSTPVRWEDLSTEHKKELDGVRVENEEVFYDKNMNLRKGAYLTSASPDLVAIINNEYHSRTGQSMPYFEDFVASRNANNVNQSGPSIPDMPRNIILHGPVGTGKTYLAQVIAAGIINGNIRTAGDIERLIAGDDQNVDETMPSEVDKDKLVKVTFHQSYGYEDFIGGIRAKVVGGQIEYRSESGIFKTLCDRAREDLNSPYVIIIDEINRGDISRIFGELITLIEKDKRFHAPSKGMTLKIPNFEEGFSVPENVFIIGTMNDSDRSIALLDVALRRRFVFFRVKPAKRLIEKWIKTNPGLNSQEFSSTVVKLFESLNQKILETKGEDFQIGHAFFSDFRDSEEDQYETLRHIFVYNIIPLLKEIYHGGDEILYEKVLDSKFFSKKGDDENSYYVPDDEKLYNIESFKKEIRKLAGNIDAQS